jgi:hypothetical protein
MVVGKAVPTQKSIGIEIAQRAQKVKARNGGRGSHSNQQEDLPTEHQRAIAAKSQELVC